MMIKLRSGTFKIKPGTMLMGTSYDGMMSSTLFPKYNVMYYDSLSDKKIVILIIECMTPRTFGLAHEKIVVMDDIDFKRSVII